MILFRLNAGPQIGFGHLIRCRSLAHALRELGETCVMVGPDQVYARKEDRKLFDAWFPQAWTNGTEDATRLAELASGFGARMLVLDDYRVDEVYQLILRGKGLKWLQFEARTSLPIWADLVINASPVVKVEDYAKVLCNPDTCLLLGPKYSVLRPEFSNENPRNPERPVERVLVTFGGGDDCGAIQYVLSTLLPGTSPDLQFLVISGKHNPRNTAHHEWIEQHGKGRVEFIIDPQEMAQLMIGTDLAIMAGGTTAYEAALVGLPMIIISIAENQRKNAEAWAEIGSAIYLGTIKELTKKKLFEALNMLLNSSQVRENQIKVSRNTIKHFGSRNVATKLINFNYGDR